MAETWRARWQGTAGISKQVAVKRILPGLNEDDSFVAMFMSEAKLAATLSHGNIAQVFDVGQVDGTHYIAMEFVDGPSLKGLLEQSARRGMPALPVPIALFVIAELCKALHHAHVARDERGQPLGIVHRDISPENVMLSWQGQVKVIDFGIAHSALPERPKTEHGVMKGKVQYMAPEQAKGTGVDALSDVWAAGIVLFEMLCGKPPVESAGYDELMALWQGKGPKPSERNPGLPRELDRLVLKALAVSRTDRYRSAQHLHDAAADMLHRDWPGVSESWVAALLLELYQDDLEKQGRMLDVPMSARTALRGVLAGKSARTRRTSSKEQPSASDGPTVTRSLDEIRADAQRTIEDMPSPSGLRDTASEADGDKTVLHTVRASDVRRAGPGGAQTDADETASRTDAVEPPPTRSAATTIRHEKPSSRRQSQSRDQTMLLLKIGVALGVLILIGAVVVAVYF